MSDETTPDENAWGDWGNAPVDDRPMPGAGEGINSGGIHVLPPLPPSRENHAFTLSMQVGGKDSPMLVLRAETAAELAAMITQVEMAGLWAQVGSHLSTARAHGTLGAGMPGLVQVAAQQPAPAPMPPQYPAAPAPAAGGWGGAPQGAPAGGCVVQPGWFKVNIPYQSKAAGDQIKDQLKVAGMYQGNVNWHSDAKHWHVSPAVVAYFQQFGPTPA